MSATSATAQTEEPHHHLGDDGDAGSQAHEHQHDMRTMSHEGMRAARDGSGTAWLPDETPMYAVHAQSGEWALMVHGNAFVQYVRERSDRAGDQFGSINWVMGMADRSLGGGHLGLRAMMSTEPWTIRGCGYPNLLATGELCRGESIHDRQHPHDLLMELAAEYDRPIGRGVRLQVYGGPAGEPALGPVAFPHRLSALPNPLAPITHHWFDSTHVTYGVVTGGVYGDKWKAEGSVFNGREPDEKRTDLDFGALDSWSGRVWFLPTKRWALQWSAGRLTEAEAGHDGGPRVDVTRVTASATYHRQIREGSIWATTIGWGRNEEAQQEGTNALLFETSLTISERDTWFGRVELSQKSGHDLGSETPDVFNVGKVQGGYTRFVSQWKALKAGIGVSVSDSVVPDTLKALYGSRSNFGFGVFLTLRAAEHQM